MATGKLHAEPLYVNARPLSSTAAQNDTEGHETATSRFVPSMPTGALQELPLNVSARPEKSTAAQTDADEHDKLSTPPPRTAGVPRGLPLYVIARSVLYSTAQKDEDGHETERRLRLPRKKTMTHRTQTGARKRRRC